MNNIIIAAVACLLMGGYGWVNRAKANALEESLLALQERFEVVKLSQLRSEREYNECLLANAQNATARDAALERAVEAEARVAALSSRAQAELRELDDDVEVMRNEAQDQVCRLLTDPLPVGLVDWVWDDTALRADN